MRHRTAAAEHLNTATKRLPDPAPPRRPRQRHPSRPSHPAPNPLEQTTAKRGHPRTDNPEVRTAGEQVELITAHRARGTSLGATTTCNQPKQQTASGNKPVRGPSMQGSHLHARRSPSSSKHQSRLSAHHPPNLATTSNQPNPTEQPHGTATRPPAQSRPHHTT